MRKKAEPIGRTGSKDSRVVYGAKKKTDLYKFDPDELTLVTDSKMDLYDRRVQNEPTEEFILNVMEYGVLQPVKVWKDPETDQVQVVFGRKRVKALREVNRRLRARGDEPRLIPATVLNSKPDRAIGEMISENEHRTEDTYANKAEKAARMVDRGSSLESVGIALGLKVGQVKNLLSLQSAPAYVRKAVEEETVTLSDGVKAAKVADKEGHEAGRKLIEKLLQEAPRLPGRKRSPNARKAREIVSGGAPIMRSKKEVAEMKAVLQQQGDPKDESVAAMVVAIAWVLGETEGLDFKRAQLEIAPAAKVASA